MKASGTRPPQSTTARKSISLSQSGTKRSDGRIHFYSHRFVAFNDCSSETSHPCPTPHRSIHGTSAFLMLHRRPFHWGYPMIGSLHWQSVNKLQLASRGHPWGTSTTPSMTLSLTLAFIFTRPRSVSTMTSSPSLTLYCLAVFGPISALGKGDLSCKDLIL
jgi:hypothetical protein